MMIKMMVMVNGDGTAWYWDDDAEIKDAIVDMFR